MSGHISVRDPEFPNYIWMNPLGRHFGMMTAGDLICLDLSTGKVVGGNRVRDTYRVPLHGSLNSFYVSNHSLIK
jgi:ribulose-5-phosphate 4-epimerase/fuculose-1-phosphate aldolase